MASLQVPPALKPGDAVRIIAPSSPFDPALFEQGVALLRERYTVEVAPHVLERRGFLAGSDAERLADLNDALEAPHVRAVIAARGGYGALRITPQANFAALAARPKWLVGFSDITLLHHEAQRIGLCSLHAENATGLGKSTLAARAAWFGALEAPLALRTHPELISLTSGRAEGPVVGGNLTLLFTAQAAGRLALPDSALLVLEDVSEASYRVDRMLTALLVSRALERVAGIVLGDFTDCGPGGHGVPVEAVLRERLSELRVPLLSGLPFGHGPRNAPLILGRHAVLDASAGTLTFPAEG